MESFSKFLSVIMWICTFATIMALLVCYNAYNQRENLETSLKKKFSEENKEYRDYYNEHIASVQEIQKSARNEQQAAAKKQSVKVTCNSLNVRSGPGKNYKILTTVHLNDKLTLADSENYGGWVHVWYSTGKDGYVSGTYVAPTN